MDSRRYFCLVDDLQPDELPETCRFYVTWDYYCLEAVGGHAEQVIQDKRYIWLLNRLEAEGGHEYTRHTLLMYFVSLY